MIVKVRTNAGQTPHVLIDTWLTLAANSFDADAVVARAAQGKLDEYFGSRDAIREYVLSRATNI